MNKKKIIIILIVFIALLSTIVFVKNSSDVEITGAVSEKSKINKKLLTMNLEQTAGAGDYKTVTQSEWPTEGYKFNEELSRCENGSELSWDAENKIVLMSGNSNDKCYVYFDIWIPSIADYCTSGTDLATCVKNFGDQGASVSNIYIHDSTLTNGAGDNSYRYAGASDSVNNYICLGSDEATCPDANLFRIIGVFGEQTKVIRAKSIGTQYWNTTSYNTWSTTSLNTYLNEEYLTSLGILTNKIATTAWKVGGGSPANLRDVVPKTAYQYEVGSSSSSTTYDAKIGLMYVTDYYYGASSSAWTLVGYNSDSTKDYRVATSINWLYLGSEEWTISRRSDNTSSAFYVVSNGFVVNYNVNYDKWGVRPAFYLNQNVKYVGGTGTFSNSIRIN